MMKHILTLLFLLAAIPVPAQVNTATLGGRIFNGDGPVEGATVVAIHQQTNTQYYATAGRGGWYQFLDMLPGGPYTVRIHYFEYKPLTVRDLYVYAGQNTLVDADVEAGESYVRRDEAATSMRVGEAPTGGEVSISPFVYELVGQRTYTSVPFDVRQDAALSGVSMLQTTPAGSKRFNASAYGYAGFPVSASSASPESLSGPVGLTVSTPVAGEDYQLFAGLQYDSAFGFSGSGRFDARFSESNRLDVTGGRIPGQDAWAAAGLTSSLADGHASNRLQAGWYGDSDRGQMVASDDFTYSIGRQRMLFGARFSHFRNHLADTTANRFDFYTQDAVRFGRRLTFAAGVRFSFPFTFSPRVSASYDILGNGGLVLRGGVAIFGRHGQSSTWKNLAAVDFRLPADFVLSVEGVYAQEWERLFIISSRNRLASRHELTARLERYFADDLWAVASYSASDGAVRGHIVGGFSWRKEYGRHSATRLAFLYNGYRPGDGASPDAYVNCSSAPLWLHGFEARLTQDFVFEAAGRDHTVQLTGSFRLASDLFPLYADSIILDNPFHPYGSGIILIGLRYLL